MKGFELLQNLLALKHSFPWQWSACYSKGWLLLRILQLVSYWSHSRLQQENLVTQEFWKWSWAGQKVKILENHQRRRFRESPLYNEQHIAAQVENLVVKVYFTRVGALKNITSRWIKLLVLKWLRWVWAGNIRINWRAPWHLRSPRKRCNVNGFMIKVWIQSWTWIHRLSTNAKRALQSSRPSI